MHLHDHDRSWAKKTDPCMRCLRYARTGGSFLEIPSTCKHACARVHDRCMHLYVQTKNKINSSPLHHQLRLICCLNLLAPATITYVRVISRVGRHQACVVFSSRNLSSMSNLMKARCMTGHACPMNVHVCTEWRVDLLCSDGSEVGPVLVNPKVIQLKKTNGFTAHNKAFLY